MLNTEENKDVLLYDQLLEFRHEIIGQGHKGTEKA
ncbi:hypothetical protein H5405_16560 [Bacillus velezensis]|nr:hypothetical protein [Bacillus velezensis]QNE09057.1 hypothetical protein H5405_16560 [Bacillus velezensis]UHY17386.1 hypothetical protein V753_02590 [Bacillus velezensis]